MLMALVGAHATLVVPAGCGHKTSRSVRNQTYCARLERERKMLNQPFHLLHLQVSKLLSLTNNPLK